MDTQDAPIAHLTPAQRTTLSFICDHLRRTGRFPQYQEIARGLDITPSGAGGRLQQLKQSGCLSQPNGWGDWQVSHWVHRPRADELLAAPDGSRWKVDPAQTPVPGELVAIQRSGKLQSWRYSGMLPAESNLLGRITEIHGATGIEYPPVVPGAIRLADLGLATRTLYGLARLLGQRRRLDPQQIAATGTVSLLQGVTIPDLLATRGFGEHSLRDLQRRLTALGLLGGPTP